MNKAMRSIFLVALTLLSTGSLFAQGSNPVNPAGQQTDGDRNVITPAVPFLLIAPNARGGAMGDVGAALSPDADAAHYNIGKLAFIDTDYGAQLSYTPWLGKIFNDMAISYLSGYYKIDEVRAVSASLRYFDMGDIQFTNDIGTPIGPPGSPREFSLALSYSQKLTDNLGIGVTGKYIHSNLMGDAGSHFGDTRPGRSVAADIGTYYNTDLVVGGKESNLAFAAVISNIGNKVTYLDESSEAFIPTNLRLGTAYTTNLDLYNSLTLALDFNKLMVPTPGGTLYEDGNGTFTNEPSLIQGVFGSFADAPGGFSEEVKEFTVGTGLEYWYNDLFAGRAGYFYEHADKGGRQFITLGVGLRYQLFALDFAYLVPQEQQHPLAETLRFTLGVNFEKAPQAAPSN
jgi:hypothetical protein